MTNIPAELRYTKSHEWVSLDGDIATIGITDFAQDSLGDVVYFDAPEIGDTLSGGESFGEVESVKAVSDVYAPFDGEVVAVNEGLDDSPELVNQTPYGDGWMIKIRLANPSDYEGLLDAAAYRASCE